jgi:hypothetical protein
MRTKTLLLTAALVAAGVASSMAQSNVYSVNIVGYVNVPVVANNFYLLGNPLDTGNGNVVTNVLPITDPSFDSSLIFTYSQAGGVTEVEQFIGGFGWAPGTNVFAPGTAFYIQPTETTNLTFVGNVTLTNVINLQPGFSMVASAYPASLNLTAIGLTNAVDSDLLFRFSATAGALNDVSQFIGGYGWAETVNGNPVGGTGGPTNGPTLNVAEGFFYDNANENAQGAEAWNQAFTVN